MVQSGSTIPQVSVTRRYHFAAAHRLHSIRLSDEQNCKLYGKCNNPHGHGHNYILYVTIGGPVDADTGTLTKMDALDRVVQDTVVSRFDHQDLNRDPEFADRVTTGENLVRFIWDLLVKRIPNGKLEKIGLLETRDNYFEYRG
jgi:6-pyruvoyltetrahydropterin/6-carboxytetrahydropterin synthase